MLETIGMAFLQIVALVVSHYFLRRRWLTLALTVVIWTVILGIGSPQAIVFHLGASLLMLAVLLRWGIVALVVMNTAIPLGWLARCTDLSAWYAQGAILSLMTFAALAAYGVWAATATGGAAQPES